MLLLLLWAPPHVSVWGLHLFQARTGFHDPMVWLVEKCAHVVIVIMTFYLISAFIPGEAGQMFRGLMNNFVNHLLKLAFVLIQKGILGVGRVLSKALVSSKDTKT